MKHDNTAAYPGTCVDPAGRFVHGIHRPAYQVANLREGDHLCALGRTTSGERCVNDVNFPPDDVDAAAADPIFEIANPFPFRGTTYIGKRWADRTAADLGRIAIARPGPVSLLATLQAVFGPAVADENACDRLVAALPRPLQLALAVTATDADDLVRLAEVCCRFVRDASDGPPVGLLFEVDAGGRARPCIADEALFDAVANNPWLPDVYKEVMVLRPGAQGESEIVGDRHSDHSHVFEYLRRNSYIPWGHYAANMAHDAIRYAVGDLSAADVTHLRHLYYQRTYLRLAETLGLPAVARRSGLSAAQLEELRTSIRDRRRRLQDHPPLPFTATLWGWNYGFDFAPSGYRLHASHQQIHQQYALIPASVSAEADASGRPLPAFACGDMVQRFCADYRHQTGRAFFDGYLQAIAQNRRLDGRHDRPADLVVHQDDHVLLFVPKAQTSQWELQLMTRGPVGNILEADSAVRAGLDHALLVGMRALTGLGATMVTVIEYSKRFTCPDDDQRLLYSFLPRLPQSPGAFSEAQLRWINGHYPEDFAAACRHCLQYDP